ncbi:MAG: DUF853 family protein [Peptoniphilaceae bacterium]|nr:DUF853 family protein [Peptoniphilaceae bacterium]MDY6018509.1 helicase HerA-like domain-containing protein [Anaerococcus sp.]
MTEKILLGKHDEESIYLNLSMINRHGLIAGATGTGKTVSLKVIAEGLSQQGIPLIIPDVKGDLYSFLKKGVMDDNIEKRIKDLNITDFYFDQYPVQIYDVFAENGIPIRTTISEIGPVLLARMLDLTEVQEGIINIAFRIADEEGLLLIDIKDLRQILIYLVDNKEEISKKYGTISSQSIGAIQRRLLVLEEAGGDKFFGEKAFDIKDFFRKSADGKGEINIINSKKLIENKALYSTILFWLLSKINQAMPEVGDLDKPKLVFFFDEAHMLFDKANSQTIDLVQRLVKSIRSKGVGIFFISQDPTDIPEPILSQLSNKIQHSIRSYTAKDQKSIKAIAASFRVKEGENFSQEIQNLAIGQAYVSTLNEDASPSFARKTTICPPKSYLGTIDDKTLVETYEKSDLYSKYEEYFDRESAFEILTARIKEKEDLENLQNQAKEEERIEIKREKDLEKMQRQRQKQFSTLAKSTQTLTNSIVRSIGYRIGRDIYGMIKGIGKKNNKR